jgi:thiosulfate/3-mercaptopyruvate sulfurtransferase
MTFSTVISINELRRHLGDPDWAIVDCRFSLAAPESGREAYRNAHIPGAVYAHLDEDLSSAVIEGVTGRHPLPQPELFAEVLGAWGIGDSTQVVAYDETGGSMAAARLWWMLHWLGHSAAVVLDGGWAGWLAQRMPVRAGEEHRPARRFFPRLRKDLLIEAADISPGLANRGLLIIDVRAPERYRGEIEPIDPIAGHIPGAINAPHVEDIDHQGFFNPPEILRRKYRALLSGREANSAVFYCGSGVTAPQSLLALAYSGLGEGRLYAGSWSDWITDSSRPIETGE